MDDADNLDDLLAGYDPFADLDNDTNQQTNKNNNITSTFDPLASTSKSRSRDNNLPLKRKRPFKQLDAELLLSPNGLTRLRHEAPWLKFAGKGHEDADLRKLMDYYHMWAHQLYPRLQFRDFARSVMKVTSNKRCRQTLAVWQEEYRDSLVRNTSAQMAENDDDNLEETANANQSDADDTHDKSDGQDSDRQDNDSDQDDDDDNFMSYLTNVRQNTSTAPSSADPADTHDKETTSSPLPNTANNDSPEPRSGSDEEDEQPLFFKRKERPKIREESDEDEEMNA